VDTFVYSSFGTVVMTLFQGFFTVPSWQTLLSLACGWALATDRHTITTYLWLPGATTGKHLARCYGFLGGPLSQQRWPLWGAVIRLAAQVGPAGAVIRVSFDDTTKKKAGRHIEGWVPTPRCGAAIPSLGGPVPCRFVRAPRAGRRVLRRPEPSTTQQPGQRKPLPAIEAFCTTDLTLGAEEIVCAYGHRWVVEIAIRDSNAFDGLGQNQCRKRQHIVGANTFCWLMAAAHTLWFMAHIGRSTAVPLCSHRPWNRKKYFPSTRRGRSLSGGPP